MLRDDPFLEDRLQDYAKLRKQVIDAHRTGDSSALQSIMAGDDEPEEEEAEPHDPIVNLTEKVAACPRSDLERIIVRLAATGDVPAAQLIGLL